MCVCKYQYITSQSICDVELELSERLNFYDFCLSVEKNKAVLIVREDCLKILIATSEIEWVDTELRKALVFLGSSLSAQQFEFSCDF